MAKIIKDSDGKYLHHVPGIIYDLGFIHPDTKTRIPFYVGETTDRKARLDSHIRDTNKKFTLVYQTTKALDEEGIEWTMEWLEDYDKTGPGGPEDEWVMKHLLDGYQLTNMKKGNAKWVAEMESALIGMRKRNIRSLKQYKQILSIEQQQAEADRRHAEWLRKEEEQTKKEQTMIGLRKRAEEERKKLEAEMAERRAEQVRKEAENTQRLAKLKAQQEAKWEADRPEREARIRAETEARQLAEATRLRELHERKAEEERRAKQTRDEFVAQANIDQVEWPEEDREHLQRLENIEWYTISQWPKEMQELQKGLDRKYYAHTLSIIKNL